MSIEKKALICLAGKTGNKVISRFAGLRGTGFVKVNKL